MTSASTAVKLDLPGKPSEYLPGHAHFASTGPRCHTIAVNLMLNYLGHNDDEWRVIILPELEDWRQEHLPAVQQSSLLDSLPGLQELGMVTTVIEGGLWHEIHIQPVLTDAVTKFREERLKQAK
jgi:hypothetical protein